jgi:hypothetical protein
MFTSSFRSYLFFCIIGSFVFLFSCREDFKRNSSHSQTSSSSIKNGKILAAKHCQTCHLLPDPALLDSKTWEKGVLPNMGPRLGIFFYNDQRYPSAKNDMNLGGNFYPLKPLLSLEEWQNILDFYIATSPDSLPAQHREHPIKQDQSLFAVQVPVSTYANSATSFLKINADSLHPLITSDAVTKKTFVFNRDLKAIDSIAAGAIVSMEFYQSSILTCDVGVLNPNNGRYGKAQYINFNKNGKLKRDSVPLFDGLQRPVQISAADLNNDGRTDYIICEFGFLTGSLSWMENVGNKKFTRHVLRALPGAIKVDINDYNNDGLPDLWVLFAQGEEGIFLFTNKGNGQFTHEEVLRFPAVYGSSSFELVDFDKDGYPDILYTCGDNADYSTILKPYHGVYIFMNDKTNHFKQKFFFPINGCYKATAADFDGDEDLDIAAISFFADYAKQPEEGFVYLKNMGNFNLLPYTIPEGKIGRWLTMDAGDFDGDGKIDLVLGNFSIGPVMEKLSVNWKNAPPFILLKNIGNNN